MYNEGEASSEEDSQTSLYKGMAKSTTAESHTDILINVSLTLWKDLWVHNSNFVAIRDRVGDARISWRHLEDEIVIMQRFTHDTYF